MKLSENKTLSIVDKKGYIMSSHIGQIKPSSVVHIHGDNELFDWSRANLSHSLLYCHDLAQLPVLELAIMKALKRSCHSHAVPKLFPQKKGSTPYQFMGFVASNTKGGGILVGFHPSSFVNFQTDLLNEATVVVCALTSRHHIL